MGRFSPLMLFGLITSGIATDIMYNHHGTKGRFEQVRQACEQEEKSLITTATAKEHTALMAFIQNNSIESSWLGLQLPANSADPVDYQWVDGRAMDWTHWWDNEPNQLATDKCVMIEPTQGKWRTRPCNDASVEYGFICQKATATTTQQPVPLVANTNERHLGVYYIFQPGLTPVGPSLHSVVVSSLIWCAGTCNLMKGCDVIWTKDDGQCILYSSSMSNMSNQTGPSNAGRTYTIT